jgi:phytanoyl-CoA hydroxylase
MLNQTQVAAFYRNGFLNGGRVLDDARILELTDDLERIVEHGKQGFHEGERQPVMFRDLNARRAGEGQQPVWQIVNIWEASDPFHRLIYQTSIVEAVSQLTDDQDLSVWHDQIQYKPASCGGATTWHQDAPLWPSIRPMTPVSAWIPLDDADEDNGCMWMVPGSHKWGNQIDFLRRQESLTGLTEFAGIETFEPPADAEIRSVDPQPWPVKRGEVSFHHSLAWHGSPTNTSPRPRRAIAIHYMTGKTRFVKDGMHPMGQLIDLEDGAPMSAAGDHFPRVCEGGRPLACPLAVTA